MTKIFKYINKNIYLSFTLLFIVFLIIGFLPIEIKNGQFLFSGLFLDRLNGMDGLKQHLLFMGDFVSEIKDFLFNGAEFSLFRYDIGLGSDFLTSYTYYSLFDPITIVAYLIPLEYIEFSYYLMILIRLYLAGIFVILLAKKLNVRSNNALLATAIFYIFNMGVLFSALRHPMFINGPLFLPLIILGAENALNDKVKPKISLLILGSFLSLITQFYFFVYTSFAFILYLVIRLFPEIRKKKFKNFFRASLLYLLGACLAGFVLLPQLLAVFAGARSGGKGFAFNSLLDYATYLASFILPIAGDKYTAGIGNLVVFFIIILFIMNMRKNKFKDNNYNWLGTYFIILSCLGFFASFGYILSGASYSNNRWMFILVLPASLIVGRFIEDRDIIHIGEARRAIKIIISILNLALFVGLAYLVKFVIIIDILRIVTQILLVIIGIIFSYFISRINFRLENFTYKLNNYKIYRYVILNSLLSVLIMSGIYVFILSPGYIYNDYYGDTETYKVITDDDSFYRVEQKSFIAGVDDFSNDGIYYGYPSTHLYNSMVNGNIVGFMDNYNVVNNNNTVGYNGFDFRSRLLEYNHVKYLIIRDSDEVRVPNGFSYFDSVEVAKFDTSKFLYEQGGNLEAEDGRTVYETANIYINDNMLNFGVVFSSYLTINDVSNLGAPRLDSLILDTIILEEDAPNINKFDLTKTNETPVNRINISPVVDDEMRELGIFVRSGDEVSFEIENIIAAEVYVGLVDIGEAEGRFSVSYETKYSKTEVVNYSYGSNMYQENSHHLVNLGYFEDEESLTVTIKFNNDYNFLPTVEYHLLDASSNESKINLLNQNSLQDLEFTGSGFTGILDSKIDGILNISIPYSRGFKAYIDGREVDILKVNSAYMGIAVEKGNFRIEFKYLTPGLEYGFYLTAIALVISIVLLRSYLITKIDNNSFDKKDSNENREVIKVEE